MPNVHELDGAESVPQALCHELFDLSAAIDLVGHAAAARIGISQTDLICLNLLSRHGPMSPGQIASTLGLTTAAISAMATRLEAGGYAHREMDPKDRRKVVLHASPSGTEKAFSLFDELLAMATELFSSRDERDVRMLLDLLDQFRLLIVEHAAAIRTKPNHP